MRSITLGMVAMVLGGCTVEAGDLAPTETGIGGQDSHEATQEPTTCQDPAEQDGRTGEATADWSRSTICEGVCVALSTVGCGPAATACIEGAVVSAGAAAIPCALAVPLACLAGPTGCLSLCGRLFPVTIGEAYQR